MNWNQYQKEFEWDGSYCDLYILDTDLSHWQKVVDFLRVSEYRITFKVDNQLAALPEDVAEIFHKRNETGVLLTIEVDGLFINCHFFTEDEIEFDLDPREISSEEKLSHLFLFMKKTGGHLQKEVRLTPENHQEGVIFKYVAETNRIEYIPSS
jgi:hypothetical protein